MATTGATCFGATAGGTLTELIAVGAADKYLTANASITFWRFRYNKHTNFAMESIEQPFSATVAFGTDVQVTLNRTGDLIYYQYVVLDIPGIKAVIPNPATCGISNAMFPCCAPCDPCQDGPEPQPQCCVSPASSPQEEDDVFGLLDDDIDTCTGLQRPYAHYTNAIGQFLVRRACLVIGGQVIDTVYNDYMFMWEELAGKVGARLTEMIGKRFTRAQLVADSLFDRRLWVPLPFSYTQTSGNALPLVSLQFHGVQISVCFETLQRSIIVSDCDALVLKTRDCSPITQQDLNARLDTTYVYLDIQERDRFAVGSFEQLITQVQCYNICVKTSQVRLQLNFNHPTIELIWAVRRQCQDQCNNHFNYSGVYGRDPVKFVSLRFNNLPRFTGKEGRYFRLVQPYQHHSLIPDAFIYVYSFAINPEDPQPSGSVNLSRIDNTELLLDLQDELCDQNVCIIVFGRNWNIFRWNLICGDKSILPRGCGRFAWKNSCHPTVQHQGVVCAA